MSNIYFIVYKTINVINEKFYIGKHKQKIDPNQFDGYFGSGYQLLSAIKKYGKANFIRETIFFTHNEKECLQREKEIIKQFLGSKQCYNIAAGGLGGFSHIHNNPTLESKRITASKNAIKIKGPRKKSEQEKIDNSIRNKKMYEQKIGPYSKESIEKLRKKLSSVEVRSKISKAVTGAKNPNFGSRHYINLITKECKKFYKHENIPNDWVIKTEYDESIKETNWFNNGLRNYLLKKTDQRIQDLNLIRGRLKNIKSRQ